MSKLKLLATSTALFILPILVFANTGANTGANANTGIADSATGSPFQQLLENILVFTNNVLIPFIIGIGFLVFVWGMFQYFIAGGANDEKKEAGKSLMIYATLGFVLIIVFWGVVKLIANSTGFQGEDIQNLIPTTNTLRNDFNAGG